MHGPTAATSGWVVHVHGGPQLQRLSHFFPRTQEGLPRLDGLRESVARSGCIVALVDTMDWDRHLRFIMRGDAYPCAVGSWTQLSIGLLNHDGRGRTTAYLWVIAIAVCSDKDMAHLATIWAESLQVLGAFVSH